MSKISDPWDHHDWDSMKYVGDWAASQDEREAVRQEVSELIARTLPYERDAVINILDLGADYGALCQFLLARFSNATAVCQDGLEEMVKLGRERMARLNGRVKFVLCNFSKAGWSRKLKGPFDAVVSSIAIHNVRSHETIRASTGKLFRWSNQADVSSISTG